MKICISCNTECDNETAVCPECGKDIFSWKCANCGEIFDASFCPNCSVEAGNDGKECPECKKRYFGRSCPDCGYNEKAANANKVYTPTIKPAEKDGDESAEKPKHDLSGGNYSAKELLLADMALNRQAGMPLDFSSLMPQVSKKKRTVALVLCLLFGWLGLHQFYVGNNKKGLIYLSTMGMFFIGAVKDFVDILNNDFYDEKGLPLS